MSMSNPRPMMGLGMPPAAGRAVRNQPAPPAPVPSSQQAVEPSGGERLPMTTSTVVAWWRVIVVIACLAAAVIAPLVLNNNKSSLLSVNSASQQVLLLQSVRGDILAAEASATQAMLVAPEGTRPANDYREQLAAAAKKLSEANSLGTINRESMAEATQGLALYAVELTEGMAAMSPTEIGESSTYLQDHLLPLLDRLIEENLLLLDYSATDQRWLSALVAVPVVLMLIASVIVARRTRRVLNIGLLVGMAAGIGVIALVTGLVTTSASSVGVVQSSGVTQATSVARAYSAISEAKAAEGRVLLGITNASTGTEAYKAATDRAAEALTQLAAPEAPQMQDELQRMIATHEQLMAASPDQLASQVAMAEEPYEVLVNWLAGQATAIGADLNAQLTDHARTIENTIGIVAIGMLVAALASGIGLSQPLRRYR